MKALPILKLWLAWRPGDGWSIRIGRDPILGLDGAFRLSDPLLSVLLDNRIYFLAQAAKYIDENFFTVWMDARDLNLTGTMATEWNYYIYKLRNTGLRLYHVRDSLIWSKNVRTGSITAALAYSSTVFSTFPDCIPIWFRAVWRWKIPLKTVIFSWLLLAGRILTWNMLQRKGFEGPGICSLCFGAEECITHVMIECPFTVQVWKLIGNFFNTDLIWQGRSIAEAFGAWIMGDRMLRSIPFHVCRLLWLARNNYIFRHTSTSPLLIVNKLQNIWDECCTHIGFFS